MLKFIFYGLVQSKTLRDMAENYVKLQGGKVLFYCDDRCEGINEEVHSMDAVGQYPDAVVAVLCTATEAVVQNLRKAGFRNSVVAAPLLGFRFICDVYMPPNQMATHVATWIQAHMSSLREIYNQEDTYTRELLDEIIRERTCFQWISLKQSTAIGNHVEYFSEREWMPNRPFTFVDCGAYFGDSIQALHQQYGSQISKIYAIEPDERNLSELENVVEKLELKNRTEMIPLGLSDRDGTLRFTAAGDMLMEDPQGDIAVPVSSLDQILKDGVDDALCIKMDLEGSEISALRGASHVIQTYRPYMVICLYHRMEDILLVPQLISEIADGYRFYLRSGVHTECYAIPNEHFYQEE